MHVFLRRVLETEIMRQFLWRDQFGKKRVAKPVVLKPSELESYSKAKSQLLKLLTHRQQDICELLFQGHSRSSASELLNMSKKTQDHHCGNIYDRIKRQLCKQLDLLPEELPEGRTGLGAPEYLHLYAFLSRNHSYVNHVFDFAGLANAEQAVMALSAVGLTQKQIASLRTCTINTVKRITRSAIWKIFSAANIESMETATISQLICQAAHRLSN